MKITTFAADSAEELAAQLQGAKASFASVHINCDFDQASLQEALGPCALHGGTSCLGAMTQDGPTPGAAALVLYDPEGTYGTSARALENDPRRAAADAARAALSEAGRMGERPDLVWVACTPGQEELILSGIEDTLGPDVPIIGGSAADNSIQGNWFVFSQNDKHAEGVVVSVLFPSTEISFAYQNGYSPTQTTGQVTRTDGRRVLEIDGKPAAQTYADWTGGAVDVPNKAGDPQPILSASTLWPLGRETAELSGVPFYLLAHPATAHGDGSLDLFATVDVGEDITLMHGTPESLITRAGRVADLARRLGPTDTRPVEGALMIYCGGCMLTVQDDLPRVTAGVNAALGGAPFLGAFTFGEQGALMGAGNRHGNLMISCIVFHGSEA